MRNSRLRLINTKHKDEVVLTNITIMDYARLNIKMKQKLHNISRDTLSKAIEENNILYKLAGMTENTFSVQE